MELHVASIQEWEIISATVLSEHELEGKPAFDFPIEGGETVLGAITFLTQHDGYHLGQIALHRRYLGLDAMAYK